MFEICAFLDRIFEFGTNIIESTMVRVKKRPLAIAKQSDINKKNKDQQSCTGKKRKVELPLSLPLLEKERLNVDKIHVKSKRNSNSGNNNHKGHNLITQVSLR